MLMKVNSVICGVGQFLVFYICIFDITRLFQFQNFVLWVQGGGDVGGHYGIASRATVAFQWGWLLGVFHYFHICWLCIIGFVWCVHLC